MRVRFGECVLDSDTRQLVAAAERLRQQPPAAALRGGSAACVLGRPHLVVSHLPEGRPSVSPGPLGGNHVRVACTGAPVAERRTLAVAHRTQGRLETYLVLLTDVWAHS